MFHFTHADAKHIAVLLNDPSLHQLAVSLVQQQASMIDKTFAFRLPKQQQQLVAMLELVNQHSPSAKLEVFLQAPGVLGFRVNRANESAYSPNARSHNAHQQQQFGMIE